MVLVPSVDGVKLITKHSLLQHFKLMVESAGIPDRDTCDIVPYSLRHFMINKLIMSGLGFREIADMCVTGVAQIKRTYKLER